MKLYRMGSGSAVELVQLEAEDGSLVTEIVIGEWGRGRTEGIIPVIGEGPEVRAKKTDEGVVLVRGDWESEARCLALINPVGGYDRYRSYAIHEAQGLRILATGRIAFGDAGGINGGEEVLAIVEPGATFQLRSKYHERWYSWSGESWKVETPEQRSARLALALVEQGGGEWL